MGNDDEYHFIFGNSSDDDFDEILAALGELQHSLDDGSLTTETFLAGQFRSMLDTATIMLVHDPLGTDRSWLYLTEAVPTIGYPTPTAALAAAIVHVRENTKDCKERWSESRALLQRITEQQEKDDRAELDWADPSLTLTTPWSLIILRSILYVEDSLMTVTTPRSWMGLQVKSKDESHTIFAVVSKHDYGQVPEDLSSQSIEPEKTEELGELYLRSIEPEKTEVIFVPGMYHMHLALTISSLYRNVQYLGMDAEEEGEKDANEQHPFDDIFDEYYATRKRQRVTLKQWAAMKSISYHWLSRHHKSYRERKLRKVADR